jgi:hypothetical protein
VREGKRVLIGRERNHTRNRIRVAQNVEGQRRRQHE